jgi:hypothetical protein
MFSLMARLLFQDDEVPASLRDRSSSPLLVRVPVMVGVWLAALSALFWNSRIGTWLAVIAAGCVMAGILFVYVVAWPPLPRKWGMRELSDWQHFQLWLIFRPIRSAGKRERVVFVMLILGLVFMTIAVAYRMSAK